MSSCLYVKCVWAFYLFSSWVPTLLFAQGADPYLPVKAVNLGNWLVTEGWMKPELFAGIPNQDLLVQFLHFPKTSHASLNTYGH